MPRMSPVAFYKLVLIEVMHSEDLADHDRLKSLIDARRAEAQSDVERSGIDMFMDFEIKHRTSYLLSIARLS
jgi:hypothetical protein